MLSTLPLIALFMVRYSSVTMQAPVSGTSPDRTTADLENQIGDLTIPKPVAKNITTAEINSRSAPTYDTLLGEIGDFRLPSNITAGHVAKAAKQAVPSLSSAEVISIVLALRPEQLSS